MTTPTRKKLTPQQETIRDLSDRIVKAQTPIRVLDALKWGPEIQAAFFKNHCKKLPPVDVEYYAKNPLPYDPEKKKDEFYAIERDIRRQLGQYSGVGKIMQRMCREYRELIRMLQARGKLEFSEISQELYGGSMDAFYAGAPTLRDLAENINETLVRLKPEDLISADDEKRYTTQEAVTILNERLQKYFGDSKDMVRVKISDGILADSAAGAESIKIRKGLMLSERDIRAFEVHEGWVHLGTTLNGLSQPICTFLSKGPPSSTQTQEGLATLMEIFTFASYPARVKRLNDRIVAISMIEEGANFLDIFKFYSNQGLVKEDAYFNTVRVFRGSAPTLGPFTKDLSYTKGYVLIHNYIRLAIRRGLLPHIPLLFLGKTTLEDVSILSDLVNQGLVIPPTHVPPQFRDLAALTAWNTFSIFLSKLDLTSIAAEYKSFLTE